MERPAVSANKCASRELTFVSLDVHRNSITTAVLELGREMPLVERFFHDEASIGRFVSGLDEFSSIRTCLRSGSTGYGLARLLHRLGVGLRGDRAEPHPCRARSQGEDRQARCTPSRIPVPRGRAHRRAHLDAGGGGDPEPRPPACRPRLGSHPGTAPFVEAPPHRARDRRYGDSPRAPRLRYGGDGSSR